MTQRRKNQRWMTPRLPLVALAVATSLGLIFAGTATYGAAVTISYSSIADFSCGAPGKVSYANRMGTTALPPLQHWLIDAYSGQGVSPVVGHTFPGGLYWQERTITDTDTFSAAGSELTPEERARIGYVLSSRAQPSGTRDATLRFGIVWRAIGILAGAPAPDAANCFAISEPATDIAAQVGGIPAGNSGQITLTPTLSVYDRERGSYLLTGITLVDSGSGFDFGSLPGTKCTLAVTLTGASFDASSSITSTEVVMNQGTIEPIEIFVDQPGPVAIAIASLDTVPSTELRVLEADGVARQFVAAEQIRVAPITLARSVPAPDVSVTPTMVTDTTATLSVPVTPRFRAGLSTANLTVTSSSQTRSKTLDLSAESHTFTELNPNTTFTATFMRGDGFGGSATTTFTTGPAAPTGLRVTSAATTAAVSWEPSPGATSYRVAVGDSERTVTTTSAQITGLAPTTTYPVTVQAIGANPGAIAEASIRTALATPTGVRATSSTSTTATLTWNPVEGAANYVVQLVGTSRTWSTTSSSAFLSGLSAGRTYTATITATAPGEALSQTTTTFMTVPNAPPAVLITKRTPTGLTLTWTRGPDGSRYEVRVTGKGGKTVTTTATSATIAGLKAASAYTVSVRTIIGTSTSAWQTPVTTSTAAKRKPQVKIKNAKKTKKVTVKKAAPGTKIRMQVRQGNRWRTVKTLTAINTGIARSKIKTRAKVRVIVPATASTAKLVRIK